MRIRPRPRACRAHEGELPEFDKDEDLQRMYSLLLHFTEGLELLRRKLEEYVKRTGLAAVAKHVRRLGTDPTAIETL
jgi:hypothetical protein